MNHTRYVTRCTWRAQQRGSRTLSDEATRAESPRTASSSSANHDDFRSDRPKIMNVIDSCKLRCGMRAKPHTLLLRPSG
ncbi:hypothetical protein CN151_25620 [Sinorhizobium meliloti]|nr:hypothetical protein SMB554_16735 [Sinorhizobium meliloti]PST21479.1 hypothetical protein C7U62_22000 [Mesorhizobium loti]ATB00256.1 hypothetical protein BWO76_29445 [Sinorhizobium meliloti]ATB06264.1 hypothetical protein BWO90_31265 [Sinorhizobium meliloti]QGJ75672.1 hypothetical protein C3L21_17730 [Sinorhizobium meliloti]